MSTESTQKNKIDLANLIIKPLDPKMDRAAFCCGRQRIDNFFISPAVCLGASKMPVFGNPDKKHISTSMVERQNLTMRMHIRRFTRLTNAFSKKAQNHCHAIALHFMFYNYAKIHKTLRVTPAMAAGVTDHVWSFEEIAALVPEPQPRKRGPYKKRALSTEKKISN